MLQNQTPFHRRAHLIGDTFTTLDLSHKTILQILNYHVKDSPGFNHGYAWPSIFTIAKHASLSEDRVRHILKDLIDLGYIQRSKRSSDKGKQQNRNKYKLKF